MPSSTAQILDGKATAATLREEIAQRIHSRPQGQRPPGLAVVQVGDDPASAVYVRNKQKACDSVGFFSLVHHLPADASQEDVLNLVASLNADERVDGILIQLPLPQGIDKSAVLWAVSPEKDVDGFHPTNVGKLLLGEKALIPCTPLGVMELLARYQVPLAGRHAVVVGRSNIVGKPLAALLLNANATVSICHSRTPDLGAITRQADILIAAVGKPGLITADMVKPGAVVVDVGMNRTEDGRLVGDVAYDEVAPLASAITPVPGGVGPMTIALLLANTMTAYEHHLQA